jgi:adenylate cyclase
MVAMLAADPSRLKLGGETRAMTMLFCDIRGFTAISEQFKTNPQGLTQLINRFLTPMTDIIMARRGTIDKYMGDCVMAFWNAPLDNPEHADHACDSALAMIRALEAINLQLEAEAQAEGRPFHLLKVGIGLNSGDCVVGNMGSDQRFDYSVLGDAVNLASRLEGQSKTYGVPIVIGEATRAAAPDWAALELDLIAVKGKQDAVRIYALLGDAATARAPEFAALVAVHARLLERYRAQDWVGARAALAECGRRDDRLAALYALYAERIAYFETNAPGENWDGVFVATSK